MSSPYGGFYLNAINRKQQQKFVDSKKVFIQLTLFLEKAGQIILSETRDILLGEDSFFTDDLWQVQIQTAILDSGLLQLSCVINHNKKSENETARQVFTLSPDEKVTSFVADIAELAVTVCASPT